MSTQTGNDLWWSQVALVQAEMKNHYAEAELELFIQLVRRMSLDGMSLGMIRDHFKTTFGIGQSAFYSRMKKMGIQLVLPTTLRKEPNK